MMEKQTLFQAVLNGESVADSPGELIMAFGPKDRIVRLDLALEGSFLVHLSRVADQWVKECAPEIITDLGNADDSIYEARRKLIKRCPALEDLEP